MEAVSVVDIPVKSTFFDVHVAYMNWLGASRAEPDEGMIIVHHYEINGHYFWPEFARIVAHGPFVEMHLSVPRDYVPENRRMQHEKEIADFRASISAGDWLDSTTDHLLVIPISRISWKRCEH